MPRIGLIHALRHSLAPIEEAVARVWPEAEVAHLLDASLSADLARAGALTPAMTERFLALARYAAGTGADGILFTCSAFGPCIEACARALAPMPVLKPNEAMIEAAVAAAGASGRIGLLASFAPTLASMPPEFATAAPGAQVTAALAEGALDALDRGDAARHDALAVAAAAALQACDVIALAQFSLARAAPAIAARTGRAVLTTPESAVRKLRALLEGPGRGAG
ncbi:MAG TPA: arylsulfatase [Acetobacteraceae bacterium]|nr:arylsulfatase [Acetobacteraceae bacterium]